MYYAYWVGKTFSLCKLGTFLVNLSKIANFNEYRTVKLLVNWIEQTFFDISDLPLLMNVISFKKFHARKLGTSPHNCALQSLHVMFLECFKIIILIKLLQYIMSCRFVCTLILYNSILHRRIELSRNVQCTHERKPGFYSLSCKFCILICNFSTSGY